MSLATLLPSPSRSGALLLLLAAGCLLSDCSLLSSQPGADSEQRPAAGQPVDPSDRQRESARLLTAYTNTYRFDQCGYRGFGELAREYIAQKIRECYPEATAELSNLMSDFLANSDKLFDNSEDAPKSYRCSKNNSFDERIDTAKAFVKDMKEILDYKKYVKICDDILLH